MEKDTKIILVAAGLFIYFDLWGRLTNPDKVTEKEAVAYVTNAANAGNMETWFAPMQNKQAILDNLTNTTYFFSAEDFNNMSRLQRLQLSWGVPPSKIFG